MKIVYIAGKFRGPSQWEIHKNVARAEIAGWMIARAGAMPLIPHKNTENFHGLLDDSFWLDGTLALMRRCDAVWIFDGRDYAESAGTRGEHDEAQRLRLPVFIGDDGFRDLQQWLK